MMGMIIPFYTRIMKLELARLQTITSHLKNVLPFVVHMLIIKDMLDLPRRVIITVVLASLIQAYYQMQAPYQLALRQGEGMLILLKGLLMVQWTQKG